MVEKPVPAADSNNLSFVAKELDQLRAVIVSQPRYVTRQFRVLLFPEHNAGEYYRIVFGRVVFRLVVILTLTYLFVLGKEYISANAEVKERYLEGNQYRKAWNYLYGKSKKSVRREMDTAWVKSW